jgi:alpha-ketoglutarate-dependent 2,4-dichlorophenoxyacetate dioxygenase
MNRLALDLDLDRDLALELVREAQIVSTRGGFSLLYAHLVPPPGPLGAGETEFADTCAAYESLRPEQQSMLDGLRAERSLMHSRAILGFTEFAPEERAALPPVQQPLVLTQSRTGRKSIYLASHASHILDMEVADGRLLLMELTERATRSNTTYRHEWQEQRRVR